LKTRPTEAELFDADRWTDGQTDMPKLTIAFRTFANAPKMCLPPAKNMFVKMSMRMTCKPEHNRDVVNVVRCSYKTSDPVQIVQCMN